MAFRGTFEYSLDAKYRLTVPAKFRAAFADGLVLAKGIESCVTIWRPETYDTYVSEALAGFHRLSPEGQKLKRFFAANSLDTEIDAAGRTKVPQFLLEHAQLNKEVVVTGAGESLEVWDRKRWQEYNQELAGDVIAITTKLGEVHSGS